MRKQVRDEIVSTSVEEIYQAYPNLWERFGENGHKRTEEDNYHHLDHLTTAYEMNSVSFFLDYTEWLNTILTSRNVGTALIIDNFERLHRLIKQAEMESREEQDAYLSYLQKALAKLSSIER
ncbi:hypothetical protein [Halobacillus hunanensis]|uniref:hypothetical protein n=1 Tax=Halobacillus hunanensis TaxID=578214 RepID=UPI0009A8519D|nr:hypothetical protein [Halobacillus hunanensis]